jgi:hypothetical protein
VRVLGRDQPERLPGRVHEQVGHERDRGRRGEQRVLRGAGSRREHGARAAGELVAVAVAPIGLLVERPRERGRPHLDAVLAPVSPGRALV